MAAGRPWLEHDRLQRLAATLSARTCPGHCPRDWPLRPGRRRRRRRAGGRPRPATGRPRRRALRELAGALEQRPVGAQAREAQVAEPRLARAEQLALAAQLEVALGELEAVASSRRAPRAAPAPASVSSSLRPRDQQAVRLLGAAADAAAQLVELREAEPVGLLDDHDRRVRDVDADLDHRRRDEHVELALLERAASPRGARPPSAGRAAARRGSRRAPRVRSRSASSSAARASRVSDASISGQTTYACRPASRCAHSRS